MIHKVTPSIDNNLETRLHEPTNHDSKKVPKDFKPTNKKMLLEDFGD